MAASVVIITLSHEIKLPPLVGFLLAGILIGPGGLSLVQDTRTIDELAEIGGGRKRLSCLRLPGRGAGAG